MLTYLRYLRVPKEDETPQIKIISQADGCLAFRCTEPLEPGPQRVGVRTMAALMSVEVDIYHHDATAELYEARIVPASSRPLIQPKKSMKARETAVFGTMEENFFSGARVRVSNPVIVGAYLKVESEDDQGNKSARLGEVIWMRETEGGKTDVRLNFHEKSRLSELPPEAYMAVTPDGLFRPLRS